MSSTGNQKQRVVVLGGGFGGVYTARALEKLTRGRDDVEVVLVNKENYFVFQPMLAEVVSGNIGILDTVSPIRRLLKHSRVFVRDIEAIDVHNKTVTLAPGFRPRAYELKYDHLVVALGSVTDFRGSPGLYEHALPFKNLADALQLRNHLIHVLEEAAIEDNPELRRELLTFVVAGGGFSGVEVVAELNDFVRGIAEQDNALNPEEIRVVLVHSGDRILGREVAESLGLYAQRILQKRGVELCLNTRLQTASPDAAILANGERIPTKTLVSTVPSSPNPVLESLPITNERGRIEVNEYLESTASENVWALGDCALIPMPDGGICPPTAQHATRQAEVLAHNLMARMDGRKPQAFSFAGLGKMGSLGHHCAVAELFDRIRLSGFPAWFMWRTIYWWKLPGLDRKLKVAVSWALDLLIPPETVQLKARGSDAISQVHFEEGEIVFRQGDVGDLLYIILRGEADVLVEEDGQEKAIARLKPGEFFGEIAIMGERTRTATIRCATAIDLLALKQKDFRTLIANLPELRHSFETVMEHRLEKNREEAGQQEV